MTLLVLWTNWWTWTDWTERIGCVGALVGGSFEEIVLQGIIRFDPRLRVIVEHPQYQVIEFEIIGNTVTGLTGPPSTRSTTLNAEYVMQFSRAWRLILSSLRLFQHVAAVTRQLVEKFTRFVRLIQDMLWRHSKHLNNFVHLIHFVGATKQWLTRMHFHQNAAQRPHIDRQVVRDAKQDFRWSVKSRLDVLVYLNRQKIAKNPFFLNKKTYPLSQLTRTTKVYDLYRRPFWITE